MMHLLGPESWTPSTAASTSSSGDWPASHPDAALIAGIAAYRRHPYQRTLPDPAAIWQEGDSRILDFSTLQRTRADGPAVLFLPSLVNRAYVLDLAPGRSMMRWLAGHGLRPLLMDWGWPGAVERQFTLTDYIAGRIERALLALHAESGKPVVLAGYCMGGLLALAAALRRPDLVKALVLLATPWDFHAPDPEGAKRLGGSLMLLEPLLASTGTLPIDALQALFAAVEPGGIARKYRHFGAMDQTSPEAASFVALEDWLNDGVPLAAPIARETVAGWYGANTPGLGEWRVAGAPVQPASITMPCWIAVPARDRIVPPEGALPLASLMPNATLHRPGAGHIGMAAGPRAQTMLWEPLLGWLRTL